LCLIFCQLLDGPPARNSKLIFYTGKIRPFFSFCLRFLSYKTIIMEPLLQKQLE
jgi:UDP-galactopyranose mutase